MSPWDEMAPGSTGDGEARETPPLHRVQASRWTLLMVNVGLLGVCVMLSATSPLAPWTPGSATPTVPPSATFILPAPVTPTNPPKNATSTPTPRRSGGGGSTPTSTPSPTPTSTPTASPSPSILPAPTKTPCDICG